MTFVIGSLGSERESYPEVSGGSFAHSRCRRSSTGPHLFSSPGWEAIGLRAVFFLLWVLCCCGAEGMPARHCLFLLPLCPSLSLCHSLVFSLCLFVSRLLRMGFRLVYEGRGLGSFFVVCGNYHILGPSGDGMQNIRYLMSLIGTLVLRRASEGMHFFTPGLESVASIFSWAWLSLRWSGRKEGFAVFRAGACAVGTGVAARVTCAIGDDVKLLSRLTCDWLRFGLTWRTVSTTAGGRRMWKLGSNRTLCGCVCIVWMQA